jgi:hypothetical protein
MAMTLKKCIEQTITGAIKRRLAHGTPLLIPGRPLGDRPSADELLLREVSTRALRYWEGASAGAFIVGTFKTGKDECVIALVEVDPATDDAAPIDATHRAFLDDQSRNDEKAQPDEAEYVRVKGADGHIDQRTLQIALAKPDPERLAAVEFVVDNGVRQTFASDVELISWIKTQSSLPGQSNLARCVAAMSRGGKYTLKYQRKDVLHASKGVRGDAGSCTVFWLEETPHKLRLVGFGRHRGETTYDVYWSETDATTGARALSALVRL